MDLIDRQAAIDALMQILDSPTHAEFLYTDEICKALANVPSARPKGKWIEQNNHDWEYSKEYRCSECGKYRLETLPKGWNWNFCPNCGADMREVDLDG